MRTLLISLKILLFFTVLTGIIYPLLVTGVAQLAFPRKANGSMVVIGTRTVGSELIGQQFDSAIYFHSRPSAISYNPMPSGGSNLGPVSARLKDLAFSRMETFRMVNHLDSAEKVPSDMLFASASGLDPHISVRSALLQAERVSLARNHQPEEHAQLVRLIHKLAEPPQFYVLGEERVNVLLLNLETDKIR